MSYPCPACAATLTKQQHAEGVTWSCGDCGGLAATIGYLRKATDRDEVGNIWQAARRDRSRGDRLCPSCQRPMHDVVMPDDDGTPYEVDVCKTCQFVWLDADELDELPEDRTADPLAVPSDVRVSVTRVFRQLRR